MREEDTITRNILSKLRNLQEQANVQSGKKVLNEAEEKEDKDTEKKEDKKDAKSLDAVAITDDPKFGQNALQSQIDAFKSTVDSGAQFSKPDEKNAASSPLIYVPSNGNVIFSGVVPCLNNLKFQFVLKTTTGNGCFIWSDGLILNKENIQLLNKLFGFYTNWKNEWNSEAKDLETLVKNMLENK